MYITCTLGCICTDGLSHIQICQAECEACYYKERNQVIPIIKLPGSMFTEGSHFIFSHGANGDKVLALCDMKKYYNIIGRYVVLFDLQNGRLDFIDKEVRRMCPYQNGFVVLERDLKSPGIKIL